MDFTFIPEQELLRDSVGGWLRQHYGFAARRAIVEGEGWSPAIWRELASSLGLLALGGPDGPVPVDVMVVAEAFGDALVVEPFVETVVTGATLLRLAGGACARALLEQVAAGDARLPLAAHGDETVASRDGDGWRLSGSKAVVVAARWATTLLVTARTPAGTSLFAVDPGAAGVTLTAYPTIDGRRATDVSLRDVALPGDALLDAKGGAGPWLEQAADATIAAVAPEPVGVTRRMLADTIEHARSRRQFGQSIASFQVLQHRIVDMRIRVELATSATYLATLKLGAAAAERARAASVAKVTVSEACRFVGQNAIQLHRGMGMSDGTPVTHHFRRATAIEHDLGSVDEHVARSIGTHRTLAAA